MVAAAMERLPLSAQAIFRDRNRLLVGLDHLVPLPEGGVDVGDHVLSMRRCRCDLGVGTGSTEPERCMDGVVVGVNQIVSGTGVLGILRVDLLGDSSPPAYRSENRVRGQLPRMERA